MPAYLYYNIVFLVFLPVFFFFNDTATTEIYTLSLHDALPISRPAGLISIEDFDTTLYFLDDREIDYLRGDRKSTRLNSSHPSISYAVFCLKKKKKKKKKRKQTKHNKQTKLLTRL